MERHNYNLSKGFTLIELLVVIGLIGLLVGGIGLALGGGDKSNALQGAQGTLQSMVSAVRGQAALSGNSAALFVEADGSTNLDPQTYLRSFVVAKWNSTSSKWEVVGDQITFPAGIYLVPDGTVNATGYKISKDLKLNSPSSLYYQGGTAYPSASSPGKYAMVVKLSPRGTKESGGATSQIVLSSAEITPSGTTLTLQFTQPNLVRGAFISNYGVLTPINDESGFQ